jgi:hypothetical protein
VSDNAGFYGINCIKCKKPIFIGHYGATIPDVELPKSYPSAIPCPYCEARCTYTQDRLGYYQRLDNSAVDALMCRLRDVQSSGPYTRDEMNER